MNIKIIHILGASGSGTTTLGKAISNEFGYTHYDTNEYFWLPTNPPFTTIRERNERQKLLMNDIDKVSKSVVTGSLCGWGDILIPRFDLVLFIEAPTEVSIQRLQEREYLRFGDRILPAGDMFQNHTEFIEWSKTYDTAGVESRSKVLHDEWLGQITCPIIKLDGILPVKEHLRKIKSYL